MEALWADKYRPKKLEELSYHNNVSEVLSQLASRDDFPHLLFYGPNGAGKKTRVFCFLNALFGPGVYKLRSQEKTYKLENTSTNLTCWMTYSNYHTEVSPADSGNQDRLVIQKVIKEAASCNNIETKTNHRQFKVVVIEDADNLSKEAQAALRRTMQKYITGCRIILVCQRLNKIIAPIRSRCLNIRISAPKKQEICDVLKYIDKENDLFSGQGVIDGMAQGCLGNLRSAILGLQQWKHGKTQKISSKMTSKPLWMNAITKIVKGIAKEQSPNELKSVRDIFYELLTNGLDGSLLLKCLLHEFCEPDYRLSQMTLLKVIHYAAIYELTMSQGSRPVYHLQAFAVHSMLAIKEAKQQQMLKN